MELYKIQKGVSVSKPGFGRWQRLVMEMDAGDSVLVANANEAMGFVGCVKRLGGLAVSRIQPSEQVLVSIIRKPRRKKK